jgi:hypothetical protein
MELLKDLLEWWNLLFLLPPAGAFIYLVFLASGLGGVEHDSDVHADVHLDAHLEVGHEISMDHGLDHGIEHSMDHGHDAGTAHGPSILQQALSFLGIGRIPFSLVAMSFAFLWGFLGYTTNTLMKGVIPNPYAFVWLSLVVAGIGSSWGTGFLAGLISRFLPSVESYGSSGEDLVGKTAEARYAITDCSGSAILRDSFGNLLEVSCRSQGGETIQSGSRVVLSYYDERERLYVVRGGAPEATKLPESTIG